MELTKEDETKLVLLMSIIPLLSNLIFCFCFEKYKSKIVIENNCIDIYFLELFLQLVCIITKTFVTYFWRREYLKEKMFSCGT